MTTMDATSFSRRIASSNVFLDGTMLGQYVVETDKADVVLRFYPLIEELPFTEWIANPVRLVTDADGTLRVRLVD